MFGYLVLDVTLASGSHASPLADWKRGGEDKPLCSRLMPPPVPHWLLESPDKLRHLVANCSSWQRYSNASSVQWIPAIVMIALTAIVIMAAFCAYFLYRHDGLYKLRPWRRPAKSRQQLLTPSSSRDYCSPGLSLSPSVTVETQLSLWALEDHTPINGHAPFTLDTDPSLAILTSTPSISSWSIAKTDTYYPTDTCPEVLLQPQRLADTQLPLVDVLTNSSVRGHPVDTYPSLEFELSHNKDRDDVMTDRYCELPFKGQCHNGNIVTTQSWSELDVNSQRSSHTELFSGRRKGSTSSQRRQSILKTCQNAGSKLMGKLTRKPSNGKDKGRPGHGAGQKIEASITRLRQSLKDSKFHKHGRPKGKKSLPKDRDSLTLSDHASNTNLSNCNNDSSNNECPRTYENSIQRDCDVENSSKRPTTENDVIPCTSSTSASNEDAIYSYAANIPTDSSTIATKTKRKSSFLHKRPRLPKLNKFFTKS